MSTRKAPEVNCRGLRGSFLKIRKETGKYGKIRCTSLRVVYRNRNYCYFLNDLVRENIMFITFRTIPLNRRRNFFHANAPLKFLDENIYFLFSFFRLHENTNPNFQVIALFIALENPHELRNF